MLGRFPFLAALLLIAVAMFTSQPLFAQAGGGGGANPGGGDDQPTAGGVEIDAEGFLSARAKTDPSGELTLKRLREAQVTVNKDLQKPSKLRKVSLVRLEEKAKALLDAGKPIPDDMQYLAGLTRISHVFFYPETQDIVIAGPAEGYFVNANKRAVGMTTGRAVLQLQDLIVALRAFGPDNDATRVISVSIDPTQEGLRRLNKATSQVRTITPDQTMEVARLFHDALGYQEITIQGVSPKTHFAQVLVEADYNMKLIGIGVEPAPRGITSFIQAATARSGNGLQRWYFQPNYQSVTVAEDLQAMELTGSAVKLVGEGESVSRQGQRTRTGKINKASRAFTTSFTKAYEKLAAVNPIYGELRNLMDLSIAAAFIQKMGLYEKADWSLETFGDENAASVEHWQAPTKVNPVINAVWKNGLLMTPIGGGVTIQPRVALNSDQLTVDTEGKVNEVKESVQASRVANQWWWD